MFFLSITGLDKNAKSKSIIKEMRSGLLLVADKNGNVAHYAPVESKAQSKQKAKRTQQKKKSAPRKPKPVPQKTTRAQPKIEEMVATMPNCVVKLQRLTAKDIHQLANLGAPKMTLAMNNNKENGIFRINENAIVRINLFGDPNRAIILDKQMWLPVLSLMFASRPYVLQKEMRQTIVPSIPDELRVMFDRMSLIDNYTCHVSQAKLHRLSDQDSNQLIDLSAPKMTIGMDTNNANIRTFGDPHRTIVFDMQMWLPFLLRIFTGQTIVVQKEVWAPIAASMPGELRLMFERMSLVENTTDDFSQATAQLLEDTDENFANNKGEIGGVSDIESLGDMNDSIENDDDTCVSGSYDADADADTDSDSSWEEPAMSPETFHAKYADLMKNGRKQFD